MKEKNDDSSSDDVDVKKANAEFDQYLDDLEKKRVKHIEEERKKIALQEEERKKAANAKNIEELKKPKSSESESSESESDDDRGLDGVWTSSSDEEDNNTPANTGLLGSNETTADNH